MDSNGKWTIIYLTLTLGTLTVLAYKIFVCLFIYNFNSTF